MRDRAGAEVGLGERERLPVRVKDVRVVHARGIRRQHVRDPGDVPDAEPSVAGVLRAAERPEARGERPRHHDAREQGGGADDRGARGSAG